MSAQQYVEKRIVPDETIPERLFACFADVDPNAAIELSKTFETGENLPGPLVELHKRHLLHLLDLEKSDYIWEAGPSADHTRILYIYSTQDMGSAKQAMGDDPLYEAGIFRDDWWMEWSVHTPYWKISDPMRSIIEGLAQGNGAQSSCPTDAEIQVSVIQVRNVTPLKLIVSLAKANAGEIKKIEEADKAGEPIPSFLVQHAFNRLGPGGTTAMGYDWESGPSSDALYDLTVFSVGSIEMARLLRENDPFTLNGLFYEPDYFEWYIHFPFKKVSPTRKEIMWQLLKEVGVEV
jgi:uncharacterized protein YciI